MKKRHLVVIFILIGLAVCASLLKIRQKIKIEKLNRTALIAVDYEDASVLANLEGQKLAEVLLKFKSAGANAVILKEDTLFSLEREGQLSFFTQAELKNYSRLFSTRIPLDLASRNVGENLSFLVSLDPALLERIKKFLAAEIGENKVFLLTPEILVAQAGKYQVLDLKRKTSELELEYDLRQGIGSVGCGLDKKKVAFLEALGLEIIPQVIPSRRLSADQLKAKIAALKQTASRTYVMIFDDDYVLGYPDNLSATAAVFKDNNLSLGLLELAEQKGAASLGQLLNNSVIPVHFITRPEVRTQPEQQLVERFLRAVRERGVRILDVHLIFRREINPDLIDLNYGYIQKIKNSLEKAGIITRKKFLIPMALYPVKIINGFYFNLFASLGVLAALVWLLKIFNLPFKTMAPIAFIFLTFSLLFQFPEYETLGARFLAFTAALVFASLALILPFAMKGRSNARIDWTRRLMASVGLSVIGGFLVAGILSEPEFLLKIKQFAGVKLFLVLPFVVFLAFIKNYFYPRITIGDIIKKVLSLELKVSWFFLILLGFGLLIVYLARSGNQFRQVVPEGELKLRGWLENILVARPRSKEIFLGYPALFFSLIFFRKYSRRSWFWLVALIGGLVPVSIINSFSHPHTPFLFTLWRVVNGVWLGAMVYVIYLVIFRKIIRFFKG